MSPNRPMRLFETAQTPLRLTNVPKRDVRTQFGALCYRVRDGKAQVLLITSRQRQRWIIPKGWPTPGLTPAQSALQEAWEEAGVKGKVRDLCLGIYGYTKQMRDGPDLPCIVAVFPVKVEKLADDYPEKGQRDRRWVSMKRALRQLDEPELREILKGFDPAGLPK